MLGGYPAEFDGKIEGELGAGFGIDLGGKHRAPGWIEGHESLVEEGVEVGAEEKAVEDV
jgi:hypothetical protein